MKYKILCVPLIVGMMLISACGTQSRTVNSGAIGQVKEYRTVYGVIESISPVKVESKHGSTAGTITGAILGGVLGSAVGGGSGKNIAIGGGAIGGAYAGSKAGDALLSDSANEIIVKTNDGRTLSIIEHTSIELHVGQKVTLFLGDGYSRIEPTQEKSNKTPTTNM